MPKINRNRGIAPAGAGKTDQVVVRPPLKWAGGKRWLVPVLYELWEPHQHRKMVEPLCGGLAVSLGLRPQRALLNDINAHVIHFYKWLQQGLQITLPMENDSDAYYAHRERFNELTRAGNDDGEEAAALFYYLNRTGYNGLCRFNRKGEFNVPFGRHRSIRYIRDFQPYQKLLGQWIFATGPFEHIRLQPGDFVYADPPYDVEFRQYSSQGFEWEDQERLSKWLAAHDGPVVLSNQATERVVELYDSLGFELVYLQGPRRISCNGDRTPAPEVLALRNL